jgi:hypothetical protein
MIAAGAPPGGRHAAEFMAEQGVDILGVQEMVNGKQFAGFMGERYAVHQSGMAAVVYNYTTVGTCFPLQDVQGDAHVRAVAAVFVPSLDAVFLSVWLDHASDGGCKVSALESLGESLSNALTALGIAAGAVKRVIVSMDSNDFDGSLLDKHSFSLLGHTLRQAGAAPLTCAELSGFSSVGDFIFDTVARGRVKDYGIPMHKGGVAIVPVEQTMSDHLPVVCITSTSQLRKMTLYRGLRSDEPDPMEGGLSQKAPGASLALAAHLASTSPDTPFISLSKSAGVGAFYALRETLRNPQAATARLVAVTTEVDLDTEVVASVVAASGSVDSHQEVCFCRPVPATAVRAVHTLGSQVQEDFEGAMDNLELFLVNYIGSCLQRLLEGEAAADAAVAAAAAAEAAAAAVDTIPLETMLVSGQVVRVFKQRSKVPRGEYPVELPPGAEVTDEESFVMQRMASRFNGKDLKGNDDAAALPNGRGRAVMWPVRKDLLAVTRVFLKAFEDCGQTLQSLVDLGDLGVFDATGAGKTFSDAFVKAGNRHREERGLYVEQ